MGSELVWNGSQVGIMLRGMGFRNTTPIYLAAGKIYNEEESMEPLRRMFPYLETKQTLLSPEEYAPFEVQTITFFSQTLRNLNDSFLKCNNPWHILKFMSTEKKGMSPNRTMSMMLMIMWQGYSSRLAAIDYTVCLHSEVFVTSQGGNFPQIMMGHRRFLNKGHPKTINPDKRSLVKLLDNPQIT